MKAEAVKELRRGDPLWVKGQVRETDPGGKWVEVQFSDYAISIPAKDIRPRKPRKKK